MHFNAYSGRGGLLAAELANLQPLTSVDALQDALARHLVRRATVSPEQVGPLLAWGDRLRPAFAAGPDVVRVVNALLDEAAARPFLSVHDGQPPHVHFAPESADVVTRVRAVTAGSLATVIAEAGPDRIGACAAPGCERVFVDVSRGGRRAFCSRTCATRVHVAAHRAARAR
ncbi:MAG: CGNR zinc finger domain-containing protein [Pseudonocardia sp.]|nr:CGNR zinc finger domain-containing protein [Pseudonocardia sp.]